MATWASGLTLLCVLAITAQQARVGAISGTIRDLDGGVIPGATVTTVVAGSPRKAVSNSAGQFRLEGLPEGIYRVQAELAGFRRSVAEAVVVSAGREVVCDFVMRLGILMIADYVRPAGGLPGALRAADAVLHLRIVQVIGPQLLGPSQNILTTQHVARVVSVLKGGALDLAAGRSVRFWQAQAGEWVEDGLRIVGQNSPYRVGDEFVGLFRRDQDGRLHELIGAHSMFRVIDGRVPWRHEPAPGIQDGMSVEAFVVALKRLIVPQSNSLNAEPPTTGKPSGVRQR